MKESLSEERKKESLKKLIEDFEDIEIFQEIMNIFIQKGNDLQKNYRYVPVSTLIDFALMFWVIRLRDHIGSIKEYFNEYLNENNKHILNTINEEIKPSRNTLSHLNERYLDKNKKINLISMQKIFEYHKKTKELYHDVFNNLFKEKLVIHNEFEGLSADEISSILIELCFPN